MIKLLSKYYSFYQNVIGERDEFMLYYYSLFAFSITIVIFEWSLILLYKKWFLVGEYKSDVSNFLIPLGITCAIVLCVGLANRKHFEQRIKTESKTNNWSSAVLLTIVSISFLGFALVCS